MTGDELKAWRISVNWSQTKLAIMLGFANQRCVSNWEQGINPIPHLVELAVSWLMHITPICPYRDPTPKARHQRTWTTKEIAIIKAADLTVPGARIILADQLRRNVPSIAHMIHRLRERGELPTVAELGRGRGHNGRKGPRPIIVPSTPAGTARGRSLMAEKINEIAGKSEWRSTVQGPTQRTNGG